MSENTVRATLRRLFFVPTCAGCGKRLDPIVKRTELNHGLPCFCDECLQLFYKSTAQMCHTCGKVAGECSCMPLKKTFAQPTIPSLFFYHPSDRSVAARAIYTFKRKRYVDLCEFLTAELAPKLEELLSLLEIDPADCIFTYVPRTDKALRRHGFDQGKLLSVSLCRRVGGSCTLPLLVRISGKEQKKLSHKERQRNAAESIFASRSKRLLGGRAKSFEELLGGKTVILVDDVITTGASLKRGIAEVKSLGASVVLVASIARCEIKKKSEKTGN